MAAHQERFREGFCGVDLSMKKRRGLQNQRKSQSQVGRGQVPISTHVEIPFLKGVWQCP